MTDAPALRRIYLDTNAFIQAFERQGRVSELLMSLFFVEPVGDRPLLVTSHLTLSELLVKPLELGRDDLARLYDNWTLTNPYIEAIPLVRHVLIDAATLRARANH